MKEGVDSVEYVNALSHQYLNQAFGMRCELIQSQTNVGTIRGTKINHRKAKRQ